MAHLCDTLPRLAHLPSGLPGHGRSIEGGNPPLRLIKTITATLHATREQDKVNHPLSSTHRYAHEYLPARRIQKYGYNRLTPRLIPRSLLTIIGPMPRSPSTSKGCKTSRRSIREQLFLKPLGKVLRRSTIVSIRCKFARSVVTLHRYPSNFGHLANTIRLRGTPTVTRTIRRRL